MGRLLRTPIPLTLLVAGLLVCLVPAPCVAQLSQAETERLFQSNANTRTPVLTKDWAGCLAVLDEAASLAHRAWTLPSLVWFDLRSRCTARLMQSRGEPITAETFTQLAAPALAHAARVPAGVERQPGGTQMLLRGKWQLMADNGFQPEAEQEEHEIVEALLVAAEHQQNPVARDELDAWANTLYGQHRLLPAIQSHRAWISARFGMGNRAAILLRRAIGFAHRSAERNAEALKVMNEAAALAKEHHPNDIELQMFISGERAPCLAANGLWTEARDAFIERRNWLLQQAPLNHTFLMRVNYHLLRVSNALGDHEQAEAFADAAYWHAQQSPIPNDRIEVTLVDFQRAEARLIRGAPNAAEELRQQLTTSREGDPSAGPPAYTLAKWAHRANERSMLRWSKDFLAGFAFYRLQPMQPSRALTELAAAWAVADQDPAQERALLERAVVRSLSDQDVGVSVQTAFAMARHLQPTQPEAAIWWFKRAANRLQLLRQRAAQGPEESAHRTSLADLEIDLRAFVALLIDEGRFLEARDALRVLREEELYDFTRRSRRRAAAARTQTLPLTPQERHYEAALHPLAERMRTAQALANARAQHNPLSQENLDKGWLDDPAAETALAQTQHDVHELLGSMAVRGSAPVASQTPLHTDRPPPGTARLQYFVRENHVDILLATAKGWQRHRIPIARTELNRRVHAWRAALLNPAADPLPGAREFHALLMQPLQAHLAGVQELHISLDGALHYLPMAALHNGRHYLVQRFGLVMDDGIAPPSTPSPTHEKRQPDGLRLAAFGRTAPDADHAALPGVEAELQALAQLGPHGTQGTPISPVSPRVLQDKAFTAQALRDTLQASPGVVHIASHFHLAATEEESSYLLLGDGERLPLSRLAQMPWAGVRLVLLSACDSAIDNATQSGKEFHGLAGVLRQAGVSHVLASLWPIADTTTATFMREFYRPWAANATSGRKKAHPTTWPTAQWLSQAQQRWLARHPTGPYAHPYHWAPFVWWGAASTPRASVS